MKSKIKLKNSLVPFASFTCCLSLAIDLRTFFRFSSTSVLGLNFGAEAAAEVSDEAGNAGGGVVWRFIILCLSAALVALAVLDGGCTELPDAASWNRSKSGNMLSLCRESGRPLSWLLSSRPEGCLEGGLGKGKPPLASRSLLESRLLSRLAKPDAPPPNLDRPIS